VSGSIPLSEEHGLNPALSVCPRCGGEASELALLGNSIKWRCDNCGAHHLAYAGQSGKMACLCGNKYRQGRRFTKLGKANGWRDKVIASEPCEKCKQELEGHKQLVAAGGVFWKCSTCHSEGVVKPEAALASAVRAQHVKEGRIKEPEEGGAHEPCGIDFEGGQLCPVCSEAAEQAPGNVVNNQRGNAVEYALIAVLVAMGIMVGATVLGVSINDFFIGLEAAIPNVAP
jgi:Flp pilus assembly pilin Flp